MKTEITSFAKGLINQNPEILNEQLRRAAEIIFPSASRNEIRHGLQLACWNRCSGSSDFNYRGL